MVQQSLQRNVFDSTTPSETSYLQFDTTINTGEGNGTARISVYDKREDFNFKIVNFPQAFTYLNWWDMQEFAAEKMTSYTDTDVCLQSYNNKAININNSWSRFTNSTEVTQTS